MNGGIMNKLVKSVFVVVALTTYHLLLTTSGLYAAFKDPGYGARPLGLGGAFCAVSDDVNAAMYNPAGIYMTENYALGFTYAKLYMGLDDVNLNLQDMAFIIPTQNYGNFGFTWAQFNSASDYLENTMILTYAREFDIRIVPAFYAGVNLKSMGHTYTLDDRTRTDPVFASGNSKSVMAVDLGAWAALVTNEDSETALGLNLKNINQPDAGLKTEDIVPSELRFGVKYTLAQFASMNDFLIAADLSYRNHPNEKEANKVNVHIGSEAWFFNNLLGARLGGNMNGVAAGFSVKKGFSTIVLQLDYSMLIPTTIQGSSGSHRMSISCGF